MRVRKLALAVGLVSALGGNGALALGLGEIKLNSTLNQPLNAEIGLLQTRGLGDGEIKVRLADPEDFERAGVDRSYLLAELKFDVDFSGSQPVIRITSREPIHEPYLDFLLETRWPSGRLLREYTLLMDLPAFSGETAQQPVRAAERERQQVRRQPQPQQRPLQQTTTRPAEPAQKTEPQPTQVQAQAQQPAAEAPVVRERAAQDSANTGSQVYGPVSANDTLWEIAQQSRVGREFSVQQTMLAIQRLNPEAFINDNINLLKKGAVLRLPNAEEVRTLSVREAISEVAVQNDSWRQRIGQDAATGAPLDARAATEDSTESDLVEGRVSLAAPGDNESVTSGSGSGADDSEALAGDLAVSEEELDKSKLENAELKDRISELDDQIDTMEQMVDVSSDELKAVQDAAEQTNAAEDDTAGADAEAPSETAAEQEGVKPADAPQADTAQKAAEEKPAVEDHRNRVVSAQAKSEPSLMDRVMDNIQFIAIGGAVLLAGLFGFFTWRRRKEEEEAIRQLEAEMAAERALADAPAESSDADEHLAAVESLEANDDFDMGGLDDVGTDDPVSEAEIHLSLGQYSEAESKLLAGLEQDAQHVDARLMLLEVYAHQQEVGKFDDHYRQLLSISDGPAADRAARLRESIAGAGPFEGPEMDFSSESIEAAQLDDISASFEDDFGSDNGAASGVDEGDASLLDDLTMDLDLDLDLDLSDDSSMEETSSGDDFSLDLDLGGDLDSDGGAEVSAETSGGEFDFDDLDLGELDLGTDDAEASVGGAAADADDDFGLIEYDSGSVEVDTGSLGDDLQQGDSGLDFDLDLSPMDSGSDSELGGSELGGDDIATAEVPASADAAEDFAADDLSLDDLESFGDDLGSELDLDSIDLDDIAGDLSSEEALAGDGDVAVAADPAPARPAPQAPAQAGGSAEGEFGDLSFNLESDLDSELNLLEGSDEVSTKLELAQAYLDMGDKDGAKDILKEVVEEGSGEHQARAKEMLERMA